MPLMKINIKNGHLIARDITDSDGVYKGMRIEFVHNEDDMKHPGKPAVSLEMNPDAPENELLVKIYDYSRETPIEEHTINIDVFSGKTPKHLRAVNIIWDIDEDDENDDISLPTEIDIPDGMTDDDEISDYLSDTTGFCHKGYSLEEV